MMSFDVEKERRQQVLPLRRRTEMRESLPDRSHPLRTLDGSFQRTDRGVPHGYMPQNNNDQCGICHG